MTQSLRDMPELDGVYKKLIQDRNQSMFKTIDGYKGSNDVILAMQRKEVGGLCQTVTAFSQSAQHLLDNGSVRLLFTSERQRVPLVCTK